MGAPREPLQHMRHFAIYGSDAKMWATARLAERIAEALPAARAQLVRELNAIDGLTGASTEPRVTSTAGSTPVEAAASQREFFRRQLTFIDDEASAFALLGHNLLKFCEELTETIVKPKRCDSTGLEGYLLPWPGPGWSDLNCWDAPTRGSLCGRCAVRYRRWRISRGLPPLSDDVGPAEPGDIALDGVGHASGM